MNDPGATLRALLEALSRRRTAVGAVLGAVVLLAMVALIQMPLQLLPEIRYPQIRIISDVPGQTSRVVEESVNEPIEAVLAGIPGIVRIESRSGDARSYVDVFFEPGYELDRGLRDVTQAVQQARAQIPPEFPEPRIFAVSTVEDPSILIAVGSSTLSVPEIRRRVRASLLPQLRATPGVEAVYMGREEVPELVVDVDPHLQVGSRVSLEAIESMLLEATQAPASSPMRAAGFEGIVVLGESGWDPLDLMRRPVPVLDSDESLPLGAIATARRAPSEETLKTRLNGHPAVIVAVHRSTRGHSLRVARDVRNLVDDVQQLASFREVEVSILFDDSVVTRSAAISVVTAAIGGALLAILLLFFALRQRRYTPLVAMVVGVSLSATVLVLFALGQSLNLLTLAGLLISVGLGLDYAIIYFDRLDRLPPETDRPHVEAMGDVVGPLLGAVLTTVAAVLPFLLVQGLVALLFRPLIITVVVSALFCFLFAVLLLPVFAHGREDDLPIVPSTSGRRRRLPVFSRGRNDNRAHAPRSAHVPPDGHPPGEAVDLTAPGRSGEGARDLISTRLSAWWRSARSPRYAWVGAAILALVMLLGGRALPFEVLPVVDDGFVEARITHPAGIPLAEMDELARRVEPRLLELEGTAAVFTTVGGYFRDGLPAFRPGQADFTIRVDTREGITSRDWATRARSVIADLGIPGLQISVTPPRIRGVATRLADADLIVVLTREDGDLLALSELQPVVLDLLREVPGLVGVQRMRGGVSPRWKGEPRYRLLASSGITPGELNRSMAFALEGRIIRRRMEQGEPLDLRVRYDRRFAGGPHQMEGTRVLAPLGGSVHLGDLVAFSLVEEPTHIERREGQRVIRIGAQLDPAGPGPAVVAADVNRVLASAHLPDGVGWWLEGELEALQETRRTFGISLILALILVLTLLIVQYGSFSLAFAGLLSIPLSGAGAVILLGLLSRPLDAMVLAGLLIAVGIVANNVILVLSQAQAAHRRRDELPMARALEQAARDRLRPITLTVLSTVLGMSPLLLGGVEVFGLLQPLAIALTGTLLVSVPVACLILPGIAASLEAATPRSRRHAA